MENYRYENLRDAFEHPKREYTQMPFWFWNDLLDKKELDRQMQEFKKKGIDGFVIHPRLGLPKEIGYLSEEYFDYVRYTVQRAKELDMTVVLYDEAMYPSGSCHGMVVQKNPDFASKGLRMLEDNADGACRYLYRMEDTNGTIRGVHYGEDDGEAFAPRSADLLNPDAVACFIDLTHQVYYDHLKEYFGNTIRYFFTDEPDIMGRNAPSDMIPWSSGITEEFIREGAGLAQPVKEDDLYYLFREQDSERGKEVARIYRKVIHERMAKSYYGQIAEWCHAHGVGLTGHPHESTDIGFMQYFDLPCQDIVWRFVAPKDGSAIQGPHSTMGKCSADAARHRGIQRNGNECFGCCGREEDPHRFPIEDMKWYLNWFFVRGVNTIYPHAFYYSVRDGRGEERPPEVGMRSGYWDSYHTITDYAKRMCALLTDSVNQAQVAVLGTYDQLPWQVVRPLWQNQVEFNYLEEELLPSCKAEAGELFIGQQNYRILILEKGMTFSPETREILETFRQQGVVILECGEKDVLSLLQGVYQPPFVLAQEQKELRCTHLKKGRTEYFIFVNEGEDAIISHVMFSKGNVREIWDAWKGTVSAPEKEDCGSGMLLCIGGGESVAVIMEA